MQISAMRSPASMQPRCSMPASTIVAPLALRPTPTRSVGALWMSVRTRGAT
jgi:hypothetical protein